AVRPISLSHWWGIVMNSFSSRIWRFFLSLLKAPAGPGVTRGGPGCAEMAESPAGRVGRPGAEAAGAALVSDQARENGEPMQDQTTTASAHEVLAVEPVI